MTLDADARVSGIEQILKPVYTTTEETVQVVIGTTRVVAGTVLVPKISYVETEVTEQVDTKLVPVGTRQETMDVTLTQVGYYNPDPRTGAAEAGAGRRSARGRPHPHPACHRRLTARPWDPVTSVVPTRQGHQPTR